MVKAANMVNPSLKGNLQLYDNFTTVISHFDRQYGYMREILVE